MTSTLPGARVARAAAGRAEAPPDTWSSGGLPAGLFQRRADRVIALARAGVAVAAFLAIRFEPSQPEQLSFHARSLMAAYALYAVLLAMMLVGFRVVQRPALGTTAHVMDIGVFTALMSLTAGPASPYFVLFNFSLLAAALRWGWRGALWTGAALVGLYFIVGVVFAGTLAGEGFDSNRFALRLTHLVTVGAMLVFFGICQQRFSAEVLRLAAGWPSSTNDPAPLREALAYGAAVFDAPRALLLRDDPYEPWLHVAEWRAGGEAVGWRKRRSAARGRASLDGTLREERFSPDEIGPVVSEAVGHSPFVLAEGMALVHRGGDVLEPLPGAGLSPELCRRLRIDTALCLPVRAEEFEAWLVIPGRDSGAVEDFLIGAVATARIAAAFQRAAAQDALLRAAAAEDRLRLGRDLHDGILQSLSGSVLKLQAALQRENPPPGLAASVAEVCELLAAEQRELRAFIDRLRPETASAAAPAEVELAPELERLALALQVQWGMEVTLTVNPPGATVPERLIWHLRQLVREAAANAARHGKAGRLVVGVAHRGETLRLTLKDDGTGLPVQGRFDAPALRARGIGPRSLRERVLALGGSLLLDSGPAGLRLLIDIPLGGAVAAAAPAGERVAA
ncbi:MAG: hypothetical protein IRZ13_19120 [Acetobacteraceae bacterium]|nr:hypothetical protein [Acetobacteraceae bacterium]